MNSINSYVAKVGDKETTFTYLGNQITPSFDRVTSVTAIPFDDDGNFMVVNLKKRGWDLPGGHVEEHELHPLETLRREVMEEAYVTVASPVVIEVIESDFLSEYKTYMLIYGVKIDEVFDFVETEEVGERQLMDIDEFIEKYNAGSKKLMKQTVLNARKSSLNLS